MKPNTRDYGKFKRRFFAAGGAVPMAQPAGTASPAASPPPPPIYNRSGKPAGGAVSAPNSGRLGSSWSPRSQRWTTPGGGSADVWGNKL
jgi:hypothetical protein